MHRVGMGGDRVENGWLRCVGCGWGAWSAAGMYGMRLGCVGCGWDVWDAAGVRGVRLGCMG